MTPLDLDAISAKWLQICGSCDAGIGECTHPEGDYRPVMLELVREVERMRVGHYYAEVRRLQEDVILPLRADRAAALERAELSGETVLAYEREIERMRPIVEVAQAYTRASEALERFDARRDDLGVAADAHRDARLRLRKAVDAYRKAGA